MKITWRLPISLFFRSRKSLYYENLEQAARCKILPFRPCKSLYAKQQNTLPVASDDLRRGVFVVID